MTTCDVAIIGGGIVGLATAKAVLASAPGIAVVVVDKEPVLASHQTGHNSGVIHAGLYYAPGSLKAAMCVTGAGRLLDYCDDRGIPVLRSGKVVVATRESEIPALEELERRGKENGVETSRLDQAGLAEHEPHAAGVAALHVPFTSVVDFGAVAAAYADDAVAGGAAIRTGFDVVAAGRTGRGRRIEAPSGWLDARVVVNCAGLQVDRVARVLGVDPGIRIVPFRGEYRHLRPERSDLVRGLIYPVPDPRFPFLGVHFTRNLAGRVEVGPNAVLAYAREGYRHRDVRLADLGDTLRYRGFRRLARDHWRTGAAELWRSVVMAAFVRDARRLVPDLGRADLTGYRAGVRAQAVNPDGTLVHDFVIEETGDSVHVLNAPSPAATSSLAIGDHIATRVLARLAS